MKGFAQLIASGRVPRVAAGMDTTVEDDDEPPHGNREGSDAMAHGIEPDDESRHGEGCLTSRDPHHR